MKAFESIPVSTTVVALTEGIYSKNNRLEMCNEAMIVIEGGDIRYRVDGGNPTASVGIPASAGDSIELRGRNELKFFRAIRSAAVDATLTCDYGVSNRED